MVHVEFNGRDFSLPECTAEMTVAQYDMLLHVSLCGALMGSSIKDAARDLLLCLLDLRCRFGLLKPELQQQLEALMPVAENFFREDEGGKWLPDLDTVRNLMPEYLGHKGPGHWLEGMTFGEFTECLAVLGELRDSGDSAGDVAGDVANDHAEHIARVMYRLKPDTPVSPALCLHAFNFFLAVWNRICRAPVQLGGKQVDLRIIFKSHGPARPDDNTGWAGIAFEVAASGVFGDLKGVEATDFWSVLLYLYKCKFEYINDNHNNS